MRFIIVVCFCLSNLFSFCQNAAFEFHICKLDTVGAGIIKLSKNSQSNEITFENITPDRLLDTLSKYVKVKIKYEKGMIPPLTCGGVAGINGNPADLLNVICTSYNWELATKNKRSFVIKNKKITLQELEVNYIYNSEIDPHNKFIDTKYDATRKVFVLSFKGVSPYDVFKKQADINGYKIYFTEPLKSLKTVSGILPLFLEEDILIEHFCKVNNLYHFYDEDANKMVIAQTPQKK